MLKSKIRGLIFLSLSIVFLGALSASPHHAYAAYIYNSQFGSFGTGNGQFVDGDAIAISTSTGDIYVLDTDNFRVQVFNSAGVYQWQFGSEGSSNGQFFFPAGIALDAAGNIYVADTFNNRVEIFNASGTYQSQFGTVGSANGEFNNPYSITIGPGGNIYVSDTGNNRVEIFNSLGVYQWQFGSAGSGNGELSNPRDIAFDSSGNIYVADLSNARIEVFNSSGVYQSQFGGSGNGNGQFINTYGIAIDSSGNIYATDANNNRVEIFNSSGVYQSQFGSAGSGNGQFSLPYSIALDTAGDVYLTDTDNHRIQEFSQAFPSTLTTSPASSVSTSTLGLNGAITATGGANATQSGFLYSTSSTLTSGVSTTTLGAQTGTTTLTQTITGLIPNTTYYFESYAVNAAGTSTGSILSTTTLAVNVPTLTTQAATAISTISATGNGTITSLGNLTPTIRGMVYGPTALYDATTTETGSFSTGSFTESITGLNCNALYHFAPYATNAQGTGYGADQTFITSACPSTTPTAIYAGQGGGQDSPAQLASILAPGPATTAYLNSLNANGQPSVSGNVNSNCPTGWTCTPPTVTTGMTLNPFNGGVVSTTPSLQFTQYLKLGSAGPEVKALQQYLNAHGYVITASGLGSPGNESIYFGTLTKAALIKFQLAHGLPGTGYFGPMTVAVVGN